VNKGELKWFTILLQNNDSAPPEVKDLAKWHNSYPNENIDVVLVNDLDGMGDPWDVFSDNWQILGFPSIDLITSDYTWYFFDIFGKPDQVAAFVDEYL